MVSSTWGSITATATTSANTYAYRVPTYRYYNWEEEELKPNKKKESPSLKKEEQWLRNRINEICELVELK